MSSLDDWKNLADEADKLLRESYPQPALSWKREDALAVALRDACREIERLTEERDEWKAEASVQADLRHERYRAAREYRGTLEQIVRTPYGKFTSKGDYAAFVRDLARAVLSEDTG